MQVTHTMITCQSASASGIASLIARQSIWRLIMARMLRWLEIGPLL